MCLAGRASRVKSWSTPAMIFSTVDLPAPVRPSRPILAPGKHDSEMPLMIWRCGGTVLDTPFMVKMYCDMGAPSNMAAVDGAVEKHGARAPQGRRPARGRGRKVVGDRPLSRICGGSAIGWRGVLQGLWSQPWE